MMLQDLIAQGKAQPSSSINQEVDLDELMDVSLMLHLCYFCISLQLLLSLLLFNINCMAFDVGS